MEREDTNFGELKVHTAHRLPLEVAKNRYQRSESPFRSVHPIVALNPIFRRHTGRIHNFVLITAQMDPSWANIGGILVR